MNQQTYPYPHTGGTPMSLILQATAQLDEENKQLRAEEAALKERVAWLEKEVERLGHELELERMEKMRLMGTAIEAGRSRAGQHVENNYYTDRTTLVRNSNLQEATFAMAPQHRQAATV